MDVELIKRRRNEIQNNARCDGCGSTLAACEAQRGKDPTAPSWFGCCARGVLLDVPCNHEPSTAELLELLREIEGGEVRDEAEMLLASIQEYPRRRFAGLGAVCMIEDCGCVGTAHA